MNYRVRPLALTNSVANLNLLCALVDRQLFRQLFRR
jgi:hypothetical protein